jgi:general stress protein YciG
MSKRTHENNANPRTDSERGRGNERSGQDRQAREAPRQGGAASGVPDKDSAPEKTPGQGTGIGGR